jgi:hypothetical protein
MNKGVLVLGVAAILVAGYKLKPAFSVRGIRNHNAGNIRKGADWLGAVGDDGEFVIFESAEYGIRALGRLLLNYYYKYDLSTVEEIINRYAPSVENNTEAYVDAVADEMGVFSWFGMAVDRRLPSLVKAIIKHENGVQPYSDELINRGLGMIEGYNG